MRIFLKQALKKRQTGFLLPCRFRLWQDKSRMEIFIDDD
jgi:hypothetical protein